MFNFKNYMYEVYSLLYWMGVHKLLVETVISWLTQFLKIHVENVKNKGKFEGITSEWTAFYSGNRKIPFFPAHALYLSFFHASHWGTNLSSWNHSFSSRHCDPFVMQISLAGIIWEGHFSDFFQALAETFWYQRIDSKSPWRFLECDTSEK